MRKTTDRPPRCSAVFTFLVMVGFLSSGITPALQAEPAPFPWSGWPEEEIYENGRKKAIHIEMNVLSRDREYWEQRQKEIKKLSTLDDPVKRADHLATMISNRVDEFIERTREGLYAWVLLRDGNRRLHEARRELRYARFLGKGKKKIDQIKTRINNALEKGGNVLTEFKKNLFDPESDQLRKPYKGMIEHYQDMLK